MQHDEQGRKTPWGYEKKTSKLKKMKWGVGRESSASSVNRGPFLRRGKIPHPPPINLSTDYLTISPSLWALLHIKKNDWWILYWSVGNRSINILNWFHIKASKTTSLTNPLSRLNRLTASIFFFLSFYQPKEKPIKMVVWLCPVKLNL